MTCADGMFLQRQLLPPCNEAVSVSVLQPTTEGGVLSLVLIMQCVCVRLITKCVSSFHTPGDPSLPSPTGLLCEQS